MYRGPGRGDPGFFSFLGGIAKKAVGLIPGIGPAASAIIEHIPTGGARGIAQSAMKKVAGGIIKHPVLSGAAAAGAVAAAGAEVGHLMTASGAACPKGFHPCKSKHGCKRGGCVRNRRMNVCNPRALRRAARRAHGFLRISRKLVAYYTPKKHKGKAYIRKPRRK